MQNRKSGKRRLRGGEVHAEDKKRFSQFYTPNITIMLRMVHKNEN